MAKADLTAWIPKFSLRTGLVLFLAFGTSLGLAARFRQETWERCEAQKWIVSRSGLGNTKQRDVMFVNYAAEGKRSWFVALMRKWVHPEYDRRIESISVSRAGLTEEGADKISRVYEVRTLLLYGPTTEICLAKVCTAPGLENLYLDARVQQGKDTIDWSAVQKKSTLQRLYFYSDRGLQESVAQQLSKLPLLTSVTVHHGNLRHAKFLAMAPNLTEFNYYGIEDVRHFRARTEQINIDWNTEFQRVLDELAKCAKLKRLRLFAGDFRVASTFKNLSQTSGLKILHLEKSHLSPETLAEIAKLKTLETLHLDITPMTDSHFQILAGMKGLYGVHGIDPRLQQAIQNLEASLPHCKVNPP